MLFSSPYSHYRPQMAIYNLKKVRNEEGAQTDARGKQVLFYRGSESRIACGRDKHGARTGLTKEQEASYEKELRLEPGTLHRTSDYWHAWNKRVDVNGEKFDEAETQDRLDLSVLRQREHIGFTLADALKPGINFILTSEDHDAKVSVDMRSYKVKAFTHYGNMSAEELLNYLTATGRRTTGLSPDKIKELVGDDADLNPKKFLETVQDPNQDLRVFIYELVHRGLIIKENTTFRDAHSKEVIGQREQGLIDYLQDPDHQPYYIQLQKDLARAKKAK